MFESKRNHKLCTAGSILMVATLAGCGGEEDSSNVVNGSVLGSFVEGAIICIDENENARCDSTDTHRITSSADGSYTIEDLSDELFSKPIVVEVPMTANVVDPVTGETSPVSSEYRLSYPPSSDDNRFVSSLSTLVNSEFLKTSDLAEAKQAVAEKLSDAGVDVTSDTILENYVDTATQAGASDADVKVYNVAKLAGNAMQQAQETMAGSTTVDTNALLTLVAQAVFNTIDVIEEIARNNQTLITQTMATALVDDIALNNDLDISENDVENAAQLAALPFDLGSVDYVNILNYRDENITGWQRDTAARFMMPTTTSLTVDEYRAQIPGDYEVGLLDSTGTLIHTQRFDETSWDDTADTKMWYEFEENNTYFLMFSRTSSTDAPVGDYSFVLCTQQCSSTEGRLVLGSASVAPYNNDLDVGNLTNLADLQQNNLQVYTGADGAFSSDGNQRVFISSLAPPHGSSYRFHLGVDPDIDNNPASSRVKSFIDSVEGFDIPQAWISEGKSFVARMEHRDKIQYKEMSWRSRSSYQPITVEERSSFAVDEIWGVYLADYSSEDNFAEGRDSEFRFYLAEGNTLTNLHFEDDLGNTVATLCLPSDIPGTQAELAVYGTYHHGTGADNYFSGCQNYNLIDEFGLNGNVWSQIDLAGDTDWDTGSTEILDVNVYLQQNDSDATWGESGSVLDMMHYVVAEFTDGSIQKFAMGLPKPSHSFTNHGTPDVSVCSVDENNVRVSWTPPDWLLPEFEAGELSVKLGIYPQNLDKTWTRSQLGATSTTVSKLFLNSLSTDGTPIAGFTLRAAFTNKDYFNWSNATYQTKVWRDFTTSEVLEAASCN